MMSPIFFHIRKWHRHPSKRLVNLDRKGRAESDRSSRGKVLDNRLRSIYYRVAVFIVDLAKSVRAISKELRATESTEVRRVRKGKKVKCVEGNKGNGAEEIREFVTSPGNPSVKVGRNCYDDSTSNVSKHANNCLPCIDAQTGAMTLFAQGSTYHLAKTRVKTAIWMARRNCPFAMIEDPELVDIVQDFNSEVKLRSM
ncbi:hypothetical protein CC1G_12541 [Coprinopsis cinerea okayama7|uniref:Uncharacterized protein n=1 Tax=Coprinopsis cinerea (strain Okayama-7 / 130 / ATCC MYA-4618 / FGSC 9003) TaxID=240176 RepID=A8NGG9_COPC7|nr:hypothetical protein CC1G_12541 [Coprinopsis cinerea okayama7\|eukprot:XP_001833524.2 hypothetical protein CC1G_12541 [Coprinopsis cinerea okayama7\